MLLMTKPPDTSLSNSGSESTPAAAAAILVVLLDHQKVDLARVARHLGVARRSVRLARPDEATAVTGYQVGSTPPCGEQQQQQQRSEDVIDVSIIPDHPVCSLHQHTSLHKDWHVCRAALQQSPAGKLVVVISHLCLLIMIINATIIVLLLFLQVIAHLW